MAGSAQHWLLRYGLRKIILVLNLLSATAQRPGRWPQLETLRLMFQIFWKKANIGELSDVSADMWYLAGKFTANDTREATEFITELLDYDPKRMLEDPNSAQKIILYSSEDTNRRLFCLVMSLENNQLSMRQLVAEAALDLFFPE